MVDEIRRILAFGKGSARKRKAVAIAHGALWPFFLCAIPFIRLPRRLSRRKLRILLIRVDGIGDLTMSAAIFPALRRHFPAAQIDLLTSNVAEPVASLLRDAGWINRVHVMPLLGRGARSFWSLYRRLRPLRYDVTIDLRGDSRNVLLIGLLNAPRRIGLYGSGFSYLLTDPVRVPEPHHQSAEPIALLASLAVTVNERTPQLPLPQSLLQETDAWLADAGVIRGRPIVALHLTAFQPSKIWPMERYIEVARGLRDRIAAQFVVVGGPDDAQDARKFADAVGGVTIAAGRRSLVQTIALLSRCALLIGNDSGPGHLAGAVGCPVIILFGNGNPRRFGVLSPRVINLSSSRPCDARCDKVCARPKTRCMLDISVSEVLDAAAKLI